MNIHILLRNVAVITALASAAPAAMITVDATDSGAFHSNGTHLPTNQNFLTGKFLGSERRSFLAFDLSGVAGTINSATLRLFNPEVSATLHGYVSPDATETLNFFDVTTDAASIISNTAGVMGFDDLGSGTLFGSRTVSAADNGSVIEIVLNGAALAALNSSDGMFLFGGALSTLNGSADQYVFGFSMVSFVPDHTRQLVLDVSPAEVPEPSTGLLMAAGVVLFLVARMR